MLNRLEFCLTPMIVAAVFASPVAAQTSSEKPEATEETSDTVGGLQEIVVTAQRRSENMQRVPIAVTAQTAEALKTSGIQTTLELPNVVPGLVITQVRGAATPYIRGVGTQNDSAGEESGVATYVDGVYIPASTGSIFSFNNIQRIEVLKGPQGTLFGRNATGGLIHVITRDPSSVPTLMADVSYADYDTVDASAYVSGPIVGDSVKADLAVHYGNQGDGFGKYLVVGGDAQTKRDYGARSKVLIEAGDSTDITLSGDYFRRKSDVGTARVVLPGFANLGAFTFKGRYNSQANLRGFTDSENYGGSLKIAHDFGDVSLTSLTAYRNSITDSNFDQDSSPVPVVNAALTEKFKTLQQEILLTGSSSSLKWVAGLFYYNGKSRLDPVNITSVVPPLNFVTRGGINTKSYAAFAQGTYAVTPSTNVTVGARYTIDDRHRFGAQTALIGNPAGAGTLLVSSATDGMPVDKNYKKLTWRLAIDQQLAPDTLIYASWNRGFKSGNFNPGNLFQATGAVDSENLDAYAVGLKTELLDRQLRFNTEAFYYDYKNIQLAIFGLGASQTLNAASGRAYGADAEVVFAPRIPRGKIELTLGLSLLDTKYKDFKNAPFFNPVTNAGFSGDASGNDMLKAPHWTSSAQFNFAYPVGDDEIGMNLSWYHNDGFYFNAQNTLRQSAYNVVNGQISYALDGDKVRFRVFAKNLFNEAYLSQGDLTPNVGGSGVYADPRQYGVGLSFSF